MPIITENQLKGQEVADIGFMSSVVIRSAGSGLA
jgi:hypothetical protein